MYPNTAKYLCTKITYHFVSENLPQPLITKIDYTPTNQPTKH